MLKTSRSAHDHVEEVASSSVSSCFWLACGGEGLLGGDAAGGVVVLLVGFVSTATVMFGITDGCT